MQSAALFSPTRKCATNTGIAKGSRCSWGRQAVFDSSSLLRISRFGGLFARRWIGVRYGHMAPYPQGATIWCSGRLPTERPAESSSSSPTASRGLGQSAHRPSGLAAAPDGALYISNDSHGRIWRVTFQGDVATTGIVPAPSPRMDTTGSHPMLDHRGHPSECRRSGAGLGLVPPPGAAAAQVALGARVFHGQAVGGTCEGLHGSNARGTPLAPGLASGKLLWGDGSLARSRRQSPTAGRTPRTTGAQCLQRAAHNSPPLTPTQGPPMCGPWAR
jgi:hypothetical protein